MTLVKCYSFSIPAIRADLNKWDEKYLGKFKAADISPKRNSVEFSTYSGLGGLIAIFVIALLSVQTTVPMIMAPFGAYCVLPLLFGIVRLRSRETLSADILLLL